MADRAAGERSWPLGAARRRILVVNDENLLHRALQRMSTKLELGFEFDLARSGREGTEKLGRALREGTPFVAAFVDSGVADGDSIALVKELWKVDPKLQVVILSWCSDLSWFEIGRRLPRSDRLLVLEKPCDKLELLQLATMLAQE